MFIGKHKRELILTPKEEPVPQPIRAPQPERTAPAPQPERKKEVVEK